MTTDVVTCRHCDRRIVNEAGRWIDPEAPATPDEGDDYIWRGTCDAHDTFTAEHEPSTPDSRPLGRDYATRILGTLDTREVIRTSARTGEGDDMISR